MTTYLVVLECGHKVPFSSKTIEYHGPPTRWWCNHCRVSADVVNVLVPKNMKG